MGKNFYARKISLLRIHPCSKERIDMKRDDKTTAELLDFLARIKKEYPSMRLCQIISAAFSGDNFYLEDKQLLAGLKIKYSEVK